MTGAAEDARQVQPDPKNPHIANGGFEKPALKTGFVPDWYYQRQATQVHDPRAPEGENYLTIENAEPGKPGWIMQGFPVDGREVPQLELSAWIKYEDVRPGQNVEQLAGIVVTFYDENRKQSSPRWIGPFRGSSNWHKVAETLRVPTSAREAIVRVGLFGAVGKLHCDQVSIQAGAMNRSVAQCPKERGVELLYALDLCCFLVPGTGISHAAVLARIIHQLVGWDKETATWWAGACELTFHFDWMLFWVRSPFPPAHQGFTHAGPTLRE